MTVITHGNTYLVTKHIVSKDRTCSCGNRKCWAIQEVKRYLREGGERAPDAVALENPPTPPKVDTKEERAEYERYARPILIPSGPAPLTSDGKVDWWVWAERIRAKRQALLNGTGGSPLEQWSREVLIARA